jgi:hypothetical protein
MVKSTYPGLKCNKKSGMKKLSIPDNKPNKLFMKNTLKYNNARGCFYYFVFGDELKLRDALTLTSAATCFLRTYSIRTLSSLPLMYLSRKRELSISSISSDPMFSAISVLDATMTSPLFPLEIYILMDLKAPILCVLGLTARSFADAMRTSLIYSVPFWFPKTWSKLLAVLVAEIVELIFVEAGTTKLAVYGKVDLMIDWTVAQLLRITTIASSMIIGFFMESLNINVPGSSS